jgi:asparagine synthase (glutamine-hydrolysing)
VSRLRGIFAFAIWDDRRERLLLARDHLGVKPLYYWAHADGIVFGSQPRAILAHPRFRRELDREAFAHFLALRYVPGDLAIFAGMHKLPAAHRLVCERSAVRRERYWQVKYQPLVRDPREATRLVQAKLDEAVRRQLVSDVPVGVFLSGGIDSSITAALATRALDRALPSFTMGFDDAGSDERHFARAASAAIGTHHHEDVLSLERAVALLPDFVALHDEPFFDHSSLPTLAVSRLARAHGVPVILSGDGADELFAGYRWYTEPDARPLWRRLVDRDLLAGHLRSTSPLGAHRVPDLLRDVPRDFDALRVFRRFDDPSAPRVTRLQLVDLQTFCVDDVLVKVDHASMACGVEVRVPFLDLELVEAAFSIDGATLYAQGERKALLKRAAASWLPAEILSERKKGFSAPIDTWLRRDLLARTAPLLRDGVLVSRGVFDRDVVASVLAGSNTPEIWLLVTAELWARHWLEPAATPLRELLGSPERAR